ncbi:hypothetical protein, partial [Klebsiella grimontii]|uniref:hypothetical protein n=1 Tax=Klebsiella grimontii TaxID=2058152 RepID=UPI001D0E0F15
MASQHFSIPTFLSTQATIFQLDSMLEQIFPQTGSFIHFRPSLLTPSACGHKQAPMVAALV